MSSNEARCDRCHRQAPPEESDEFLHWEVLDESDSSVICPDCITPAEQQAMDEQVMDEQPLIIAMDGRAIDVAPTNDELVRVSIDGTTFADVTPAGARSLAAQLVNAAGIAQPGD